MTLHDKQSNEIAALNDLARKTFLGCRVMLTQGIQNLPDNLRFEVLQQVRGFEAFTPDNDPYGEHDFGAFTWQGHRVYWKFDYYDQHMDAGSPDSSDPVQTTRVLTILLAEEY
jgi:hypothetical protein